MPAGAQRDRCCPRLYYQSNSDLGSDPDGAFIVTVLSQNRTVCDSYGKTTSVPATCGKDTCIRDSWSVFLAKTEKGVFFLAFRDADKAFAGIFQEEINSRSSTHFRNRRNFTD